MQANTVYAGFGRPYMDHILMATELIHFFLHMVYTEIMCIHGHTRCGVNAGHGIPMYGLSRPCMCVTNICTHMCDRICVTVYV